MSPGGVLGAVCGLLMAGVGVCSAGAEAAGDAEKVRLLVVDSYHPEYLWSQETQKGLCAAMLEFGYLDSQEQSETFTRDDEVERSRAVVKKLWMDTKRKYSTKEIAETTARLTTAVTAFHPDLLLLGDDNAANYLGNQFLDTALPVVFWGVNGWPVKYGLIESLDAPGHNVTGVWQSTYFKESLDLLHRLVPDATTFAVLACDSETTVAKAKQLMNLDAEGQLPLKLVEVVRTNALSTFQQQALALAGRVDAFFLLNHDTIKNDHGGHVDQLEVGRWYLEHIRKPEATDQSQFVREGMLCAADDSGFNQGGEAFSMAVEILARGAQPAQMKPRTPKRGPLMVNRWRAARLGIPLDDKTDVIEVFVDEVLALPEHTAATP